MLATPRSIDLDCNYSYVILTCLFFVTSLGVPHAITRLNLFSLTGSSSHSFFTTGFSETPATVPFLAYGNKSCNLKASIFFCFSVF